MTNLHDEIEDNLQLAYSAGWRGCLNRKVNDERSRRLVQDIIENDMVEATTRILTVVREAVLAGLPEHMGVGLQPMYSKGYNTALDQAIDSVKRVLGGGE